MICQKGSLVETAVLKTWRWKLGRADVMLSTCRIAAQDRGGCIASAITVASRYLSTIGVEP